MNCLHCLTRQIIYDLDPRDRDAKGSRPPANVADTLSGGDALCRDCLAASLPQPSEQGTCGATAGDAACTLPSAHEVYGYPADSHEQVRIHRDDQLGVAWPE